MPRRNEKFGAGGANKVHYGRCASAVLISDMDFSRLTPPGLQNPQVCLWDNNKRDTTIRKAPQFTVNYIDEGNSKLIHLFSLIFKFSNMAECTMFNIDRISNTNLRSAHSDNTRTRTQSPLRFKPYLFSILHDSDPAAALSSIMLFLLSDTVHMKGMTTGWSKIPGGPTGEWKATSWCRGTRITNVELPQAPAILLFNLRASKNLACPQPVFLSFDSLRAREHFLFFPPHPHSLAHAVY